MHGMQSFTVVTQGLYLLQIFPHVSAKYFDNLQGVTTWIDVYSINGNLL